MTPPIGSARSGIVGSTVGSIPDTVVHEFRATNFDTGDSVWTNSGPGTDASVVGDPQSVTHSDGAAAVEADGTDDHAEFDLGGDLEGSALTSFAVEFTIEYTADNDTAAPYGLINSDNEQRVYCYLDRAEDVTTEDDGNFVALMYDDSGNRLFASPSSNPGLNDGNRHDVSIIYNDTASNDVTIIIDGTTQSVSFGQSESPSNFVAWDHNCGIFSLIGSDGTSGNYMAGKQGAIRWHDQAINEQTIDDY